MGNASGRKLQAVHRRVMGAEHEAGTEITQPKLWCEELAESKFDVIKQAYDAATPE